MTPEEPGNIASSSQKFPGVGEEAVTICLVLTPELKFKKKDTL